MLSRPHKAKVDLHLITTLLKKTCVLRFGWMRLGGYPLILWVAMCIHSVPVAFKLNPKLLIQAFLWKTLLGAKRPLFILAKPMPLEDKVISTDLGPRIVTLHIATEFSAKARTPLLPRKLNAKET